MMNEEKMKHLTSQQVILLEKDTPGNVIFSDIHRDLFRYVAILQE